MVYVVVRVVVTGGGGCDGEGHVKNVVDNGMR